MGDFSLLNDRLSHQVYNNWTKGKFILIALKTGLVPFLDDKARDLQQYVLRHVPASSVACTVCTGDHLRKGKYVCPSGICTTILQVINTEYTHHPPGTVKLVNTDNQAWCDTARYWEIAKAYISTPGYANKRSSAETDCVGLLTIIINCTWFQNFLAVVPAVFKQIKDARNAMMHSDFTMASDDLDDLFDDCMQVLQDSHYLATNLAAQGALARIRWIKDTTLPMSGIDLLGVMFSIDEVKAHQEKNTEAMSSTTTLKEEGNAKFKNGDFDGAMSCYTQALEIKEREKAVIFKNRAMCRLKVEDFEGAVSDTTKALEIAPNDRKALYIRCTAYESLGKVEDAYRDAAMFIKVDPKDPIGKLILNRLTTIIRQKMRSTTEEGNEKFKNGDFDGALSCYTQALEISEIKETEKAVIFKNRAMCRLKVDDFEGAVSDTTKALEIAPNDRKALYRRCTAYESLGKVEDAYRDAAMFIKVDPKDPIGKLILNRLTTIIRQKMRSTTEEGNEKFKNGDFDGALSCYTQALEISEIKETEKAVIFKNRAMCRLKVDDFEGAVSDTTKALEIAPNDRKALYRRCTAYESLGKVEDAYRDAAMFIKVDPKDPIGKLILNRLTPIIRQKEDVFISNITMATGEGAEDGEEWASELLSKLCEDVGFSEEEWRLRLRTCDMMSTFTNYNVDNIKMLHIGSLSEGLAADILGSDIDIMYVLSGIKVTESDVISPDEENDVYKAISSNHPACYMMNLRHTGKGLIRCSLYIRNCLEIDPHSNMLVLNGTGVQTMTCNGLVTETVQHEIDIDVVISLHCPSWPTVSEKWKHRLKPSGWPSPELVERVTKLGCEFVPTGNPLSLHYEIEWRLSSSAAERVLIRSLNIVQIQSFFLLKLVLVYLIKPCVPESLCSYHMKNIILWQVEKTDRRTWRRDNLAQCFNECLKALYQYLENGDLPHYFIPQQNLFDPKVQGDVRIKLIGVVGGLVQEGWQCLLRCPPFTNLHIGCMHKMMTRCPCYIRETSVSSTFRKVGEVNTQLQNILSITRASLVTSTQDCFNQTMSHIMTLQRNTVTDEIYSPSQLCIDILNTAMSNHMGYMMLTLTIGPHGQKNTHIYQILKSAERHLEINCDVDLTSCRLKLATFYYRLGQVDKCIRVVHDVLEKFTTRTVVFTGDSIRVGRNMHSSRVVQNLSGLLSISDDLRALLRNVSFPIVFSPWEIINAPPAVQGLAFHRRFESSLERDNFKVVAIDSLVYAYYLMTISYREIGRPVQAERSLNYLRRMLRRPRHYQVYYPYEAQQLLYHCTKPQRQQRTSGVSTLTTCL